MSDSKGMPYLDALHIAQDMVEQLRPYCQRTPEISGSLRRQKPMVGDIEIVCLPALQHYKDLFDEDHFFNPFENIYWCSLGRSIKSGNRFKQFALAEGINLDLYVVLPPAQWGVIYTIRTGPAEFSRWIVTQRNKGGCLPSDCQVKDGGVYLHNRLIPMPEERDFLSFLGLGWVDPVDREGKWPKGGI
jgi:DNA polymerase/3'-5' exonuclease PolX